MRYRRKRDDHEEPEYNHNQEKDSDQPENLYILDIDTNYIRIDSHGITNVLLTDKEYHKITIELESGRITSLDFDEGE